MGHFCALCKCGDEKLVSCGMWCCVVCYLILYVTVDEGSRLHQNVMMNCQCTVCNISEDGKPKTVPTVRTSNLTHR